MMNFTTKKKTMTTTLTTEMLIKTRPKEANSIQIQVRKIATRKKLRQIRTTKKIRPQQRQKTRKSSAIMGKKIIRKHLTELPNSEIG